MIVAGEARTPSRAAFAFIFVTVVLDMLAIGLIMPVLPKLIETFTGGNAERAARIFGLFAAGFAVMQLSFAPLLGAISDRFGRRPVVLLSNFGLALDYLIMAFAPSLVWLFIGRLASGATSASISTAFAYLADITPPERRAAAFGKVGAAFGVGFVLGPAAGGLLSEANLHLPFYVAAALGLANTLYGVFVLPESLAADKRAAFQWRRANPFAALGLLGRHARLKSLAAINFLSLFAQAALPSTYVLFAAARFGWSPFGIGLSLAVVGLASILTRWFVVGRAVARLGEMRAIVLGYASGLAGFIVLALVPNGVWAMSCIAPLALWSIADPAMQSLMSRCVGADEQGRLQGALTSVAGVAQLVAPLLFTWTFAASIGADARLPLPGAPFLLAAMLLAAAIIAVTRAAATRSIEMDAGRSGNS